MQAPIFNYSSIPARVGFSLTFADSVHCSEKDFWVETEFSVTEGCLAKIYFQDLYVEYIKIRKETCMLNYYPVYL